MSIIAAAGTMKRGDIDDAPNLPIPHVMPTRAAARGNNGGPQAVAPDVDPQERIDSLFVHLGTGTSGLSGREAEGRLVQFRRQRDNAHGEKRAACMSSGASSPIRWRCCCGWWLGCPWPAAIGRPLSRS